MTADEFLLLPESILPCELIEGHFYIAPAPDRQHQVLAREFVRYLLNIAIGELYVAPTDVKLTHNTIVQPDVFWLAPNNQAELGAIIVGVPDLIIEVLSPSSALRDRRDKRQLYEYVGVREYWLADPKALGVEVYVHNGERLEQHGIFGEGDTLNSPVLQRDVPLSTIFTRLTG